MKKPFRCLALSFVLVAIAHIAAAQTETKTRVSAFDYYPVGHAHAGLLKREIIQPDESDLCLVTEYTYDQFGNKASAKTRNCDQQTHGLPEAIKPNGIALFEERTSSADFFAGTNTIGTPSCRLNWPLGQYPTTSRNALDHSETREFNPCFGTVSKLTGPNGFVTTWEFDGFGRKSRERRADGTQTTWEYFPCTSGCSIALKTLSVNYTYFVQATPRDSAGNAIGAYTRKYYDALNREIRTETQGFDGTLVFTSTEYDSRGRIVAGSQPHYPSQPEPIVWTVQVYDDFDRVIQVTDPVGAVTITEYSALVVTVRVDPDGSDPRPVQIRRTTKNSQGQTKSVETNMGSTDPNVDTKIDYEYEPFGNLARTIDPLGNVTSLTYDVRGRKTVMLDPDMGKWTYQYNALGELVWQCDPASRGIQSTGQPPDCTGTPIDDCTNGSATCMRYDKLGRMKRRTERDFITTWIWDSAVKGIGKLGSVSTVAGYSRAHTYDVTAGRPENTVVTIGSETFTSTVTYSATTGRTELLTYPSHGPGVFVLKHVYNARGYLAEVRNNADNALIWRADTLSPSARVRTETLGNERTTTRGYDEVDRLKNVSVSGTFVQDDTYDYDLIGNLKKRTWKYILEGVPTQVAESFGYDDLNRVKTSYGATLPTRTYDYNKIGNIVYKSDLGTYAYPPSGSGSVRPHAVTSVAATTGVFGGINASYTYDANGNRLTANGTIFNLANTTSVTFSQFVNYMSFNLPITAQHTQGGATYSYTYTYGADHQRVKLVTTRPTETINSIYVHPDNAGGLMYERDVSTGVTGTVHRYYVTTSAGLIGFFKVSSTGQQGMHYYHRDHLGSIVAVTGPSGGIVQAFSYEAFGERRAVNGGRMDRTSPPLGFATSAASDRGFTAHEHLDELNLIHMNGRIYDPALGRFMTADPFVPVARDLQSFNRYSYTRNNPLAYTDPDGHCPIFCWAVIVFIAAEVANQANIISEKHARLIQTIAVGAAFGPGIGWGSAIANGAIGGFASGLFASGGDFEVAFKSGLVGAAFGWAGGVNPNPWDPSVFVAHAAVGCLSGEMMGGGCGAGAASAVAGKLATNVSKNIVVASVAGGTVSVIGGGKFANGAVTGAFGFLFNYCSQRTAKCALEHVLNVAKLFGGGVQATVGVGMCLAGGIGCLAGGPVAVVGASQVIEGITYYDNENIDGFNPAKHAAQSAAVALGGTETAGASAYHLSEVITGFGALAAPVTATTGWVSMGTRNPMTRTYGEITYPSTRFEQMGRTSIMINTGSGAVKVYDTIRPEAQ
jgi:RHS repeat-associated protein